MLLLLCVLNASYNETEQMWPKRFLEKMIWSGPARVAQWLRAEPKKKLSVYVVSHHYCIPSASTFTSTRKSRDSFLHPGQGKEYLTLITIWCKEARCLLRKHVKEEEKIVDTFKHMF